MVLACRAFPREHRARRSDEVVDTALLAAGGSLRRAAREAFSLVLAGARQRLRTESHRSARDGAALLAGVLALVNLAVALTGITAGVYLHGFHLYQAVYGPYVIDGWWVVFTAAAVATVLGLALGVRRLALGGAFVNLGVVVYDAIFLVGGSPYDGRGHFDVFTYTQTSSVPAGREWLAAAIVLAVATAVARPRRVPLMRLPLALIVVVSLVVLSRETWGAFFFLRWPLAVVLALAFAFGAFAPRLSVLAVGGAVAAAPSAVVYMTAPNLHHHPSVTGFVAVGLALGAVLPFASLVRRRLT
ncbi:MAG TPA: hypothetical protein VFU64_09660 [Gaiellaceae bacterium]|nr:hypothetical protein [Gaiellaceae bacterium]